MAPNRSEELLKLPTAERIKIANAHWASLAADDIEAETELTPELKAELDRRWAEHLGDPDSAIPWEEVKRRIRSRNTR